MDDLLTLPDVCKKLNVSVPTIYRWMQKYGFPKPIKLVDGQNGAIRWDPKDVAAFIEARKRAA